MNRNNTYRHKGKASSFRSRPRTSRKFDDKRIDISRIINTTTSDVEVIPYVSKHNFSDFPIEEHLKINIKNKQYLK